MRHGFWCHWKWVIWCFACFWGPRKSAKCCRGVCMHQIILFLEFGYFGLWRTHLQNYTFLGHLRSTGTLTSQSFLFIFNVNYEQKWHLKVCADARAICPTGFLFSLPAYAVWYLDTKTFFEYKTIAKKKCAPKTRATLAMPNILFADFWGGIQNVVCSKIFCYCNLKHCLKFMKLCFMLSKVPWATIYWLKRGFFEILENILQQKWDNPEFFTKFYKLLKHVS